MIAPFLIYVHKTSWKLLETAFSNSKSDNCDELKDLKTAIEIRREDVLQCQFKDDFQTYSAVQYAIKLNDVNSLQQLISFQADLGISSLTLGTALHFYVDCLKENEEPNLEILTLLLDHSSHINQEEKNYFFTPLEYAVKHMRLYKNIHWNVIDLMLSKGIRVSNDHDTTPFQILKDSHNHKIKHNHMIRTLADEKLYFSNIMSYIAVEKKYHPNSWHCFTLEEFKLHTFNSNTAFVRKVEALKSSTPDTGSKNIEINNDYLNWFKVLVKGSHFKECFEKWQVKSMDEALRGLNQ